MWDQRPVVICPLASWKNILFSNAASSSHASSSSRGHNSSPTLSVTEEHLTDAEKRRTDSRQDQNSSSFLFIYCEITWERSKLVYYLDWWPSHTVCSLDLGFEHLLNKPVSAPDAEASWWHLGAMLGKQASDEEIRVMIWLIRFSDIFLENTRIPDTVDNHFCIWELNNGCHNDFA